MIPLLCIRVFKYRESGTSLFSQPLPPPPFFLVLDCNNTYDDRAVCDTGAVLQMKPEEEGGLTAPFSRTVSGLLRGGCPPTPLPLSVASAALGRDNCGG